MDKYQLGLEVSDKLNESWAYANLRILGFEMNLS